MMSLLYGVCWVMGPLYILTAVLTISEGGNPIGFIPSIIGPFGVILYIHNKMGWYPFRKKE
jgi:hypothetical protein